MIIGAVVGTVRATVGAMVAPIINNHCAHDVLLPTHTMNHIIFSTVGFNPGSLLSLVYVAKWGYNGVSVCSLWFRPVPKDVQFRNKWRRRIKGAASQPRLIWKKWPLWCVFIMVLIRTDVLIAYRSIWY